MPAILDVAAQLPPRSNLSRWTRMGFGARRGGKGEVHFPRRLPSASPPTPDFVIFSGGKGIGGPQTSGLLLGRTELIEAARLNGSPNEVMGRTNGSTPPPLAHFRFRCPSAAP